MHVLLIHQAFVGPGEAGGTRHYELAQACARQGHRVTIISSSVNYLSGVQTQVAARAEVAPGVVVIRARTLTTLHRSFLWRIAAFLGFMVTSVWAALRVGSVDVVIGTTPPIFQVISAWLVALLRRRPFLLEVRDLWPEFGIRMGVLTNPIVIKLARWLESFLYGRATHFLVNSPAYLDYLVARGVPAAKVTLIPNGVDPTMFDPDADGAAFRRVWNLTDGRSPDRFVVTYAGALGLANDIPTLLAAAGQLQEHRDIHFLVVGDGKERGNLETMAAQMALSNITFTGALPKEQMPEVLAASDACVAILQDIPIFRTTYPNKVFDYMAAGRPTLLAIDGVIRDVIDQAAGGLFVPPGDDSALAAAIETLARDRENARLMGLRARAYVAAHFDRATQAQQFVALLESLR